jgi:uncharacterized protein (TIGR01319 family)
VDRGFEEPALKRTVEGDLGMRAGAMSLVESENSFIASELLRLRIPRGNFDGFVRRAASDNSFIGTGAEGESSDFILAEACLKGAASRHAGYMSEVFTPSGRVHVRRGKDLRPTRRVIGTGGYLSRHISGEICARSFEAIPDAKGAMPLFPDMERVELYRDASYVLPMLGAMASEYPEQAVGIALSNLEKIE